MPKKTTMTEQIYQYLQTIIPEQGYAPSVREICQAVGLKSPSTVHFHLKRLQEQGLIEKGDFKGRAIVLTQKRQKNRVPIAAGTAAGEPVLTEECGYLTFDCGGREDEFFALYVQDSAMVKAGILPGDLVVVHRQQAASSGEITAALLENKTVVRRLLQENGQVWLLPESENELPVHGEEARLLGKVTAVIRQYS